MSIDTVNTINPSCWLAQRSDVEEIIGKYFDISGDIDIVPEGQGNINDTYRADIAGRKIILQRINSRVFPDQQKVAENFATISKHIQLQVQKEERCFFPEIIPALNGKSYVKDRDGGVWRAQRYIENTKVYEKLTSPKKAHHVGRCLARFHNFFKDVPPEELHITLPGFHNLPLYLEKYDRTLNGYCNPITDKHSACFDLVRETRIHSNILERAKKRGEVAVAVTHGDPKVSNILFDRESDKALTLIDFDTVGPGLIIHDIGDCLRSCCCSIDENEYVGAPVTCELKMVAGMLAGYFSESVLSPTERNYIFEALFLLTFELGLRFLTDHLQGNRYFKIINKDDNLHRALVQFELVANIWLKRDSIREIVEQTYERKEVTIQVEAQNLKNHGL